MTTFRTRVLAGLGIMAVVCACGSPSPSQSAIDFPDPQASPPPPWASVRSTDRVTQPFSGVGNQYVMSAVAYGNGFVGVGEDLQIGGRVDGRIWWSPDGLSWNGVDVEDASLADAAIDLVASNGRRLVAVGRGRADDRRPDGPGIEWVSDDAKSWDRLEGPPFPSASISGMVGSPTGFVAWGGSEADGQLFFSADGRSWESIQTGKTFAASVIYSLMPYRGGYVAVGAHVPPGSGLTVGGPTGQTAAAWWSPDGRTWHAGTTDSGPNLTQLFVGAGGLLALGASECGSCISPPIEWRSDDGRSWRRLPSDTDEGIFPIFASDGGRIIRFDWQGSDEITSSLDGSAWDPLGAPGKADLYSMVVGRNGVLVLESIPRGTSTDEVDGAVWYLPAS